MGFIYTKKKEEDKQREKTVPSEEFVNLMIRTKKSPDKIKEIPKTESK